MFATNTLRRIEFALPGPDQPKWQINLGPDRGPLWSFATYGDLATGRPYGAKLHTAYVETDQTLMATT